MKPFDACGEFRPTMADGGLTQRAVRGAAVSIVSGAMILAVQIVSTVVLVRLLTPDDFGLMAMATTFSILLLNFGVNGFTEAIIQREHLDQALTSNLFWINATVGFLLSIGFAAGGLLLSRFYGDHRVVGVAAALAVTIFLTSVSVQHLALLKRAMRFSAVSANDIVARVLSVGVSIVLGYRGWGYWALVAGALAIPLSTSIGAWFLCRWIPGRPGRASGTRETMTFALHTYGRFTVNYIARNVDNLLVGWQFGSHTLGFYKKAYDLFALPVSQVVGPVNEVALSTLSRLNPRSAQYRQCFLGALSILAFLGMASAAVLTLSGKDLIRLLLGTKWEPAGQIFTYFGPGIGAMFVYQTHGWLHLSVGKANRWLRWGIIEVTVTILLFLVALPWGVDGIAVAWATSFWILTVPALWYAGRPIGLGLLPMVGAIWRYILSALIAGFAADTLVSASHLTASIDVAGAVQRIIAVALSFSILYIGFVILLHGGCGPLYQFVSLAQQAFPWAKASRARTLPGETGVTVTWAAFNADRYATKPLVSILIPAFNAQEWIADTLRSAIAQSWEPKEIIVVDDGSRDGTLAIARQFEAQGVRVVTQPNQGASAARNRAFSLSKGDYIQWLDADDLLAPDKIVRQMELAATCPNRQILLSSSFGRFNYRPHRATFAPTTLWFDLPKKEWLLRKLGQNVYMQTATWLVSRELTDIAGPWDSRLLGDDDGEYFCRVLLASEGTRFVPEAKVYYRAPLLKSLSSIGHSPRKIRAHWLSMQLHIGYLRSLEDTQRVRAACIEYLHDNLIYFYPESSQIVAEMQEMARELGGTLDPPLLSWKYSWVRWLFGWRLAKLLQVSAPTVKWVMKRNWDKLLFHIELRTGTSSSVASGLGLGTARTTTHPIE
jgi:PST family polysaccharide transporter